MSKIYKNNSYNNEILENSSTNCNLISKEADKAASDEEKNSYA